MIEESTIDKSAPQTDDKSQFQAPVFLYDQINPSPPPRPHQKKKKKKRKIKAFWNSLFVNIKLSSENTEKKEKKKEKVKRRSK